MQKKGVGVLRTNSIEIEFDEETQHYYIIWKPIVISSGKTREEALEDLKVAAHYGVDTLIDLKLRDMRVRGKTRFQESSGKA
jgi:predicted RNase H-like HicB family nuclease